MGAHTPGPWFAQVGDSEARIWRRDPADLYENGGGVAGDRTIASVHLGWSGEDEQGFPVAANARLIAAAPELLDALQSFLAEADAGHVTFETDRKARAALSKALPVTSREMDRG